MIIQKIIVYLLFAGAIGYVGRLFYNSVFRHKGNDEVCKECSQYSGKKPDHK